ncbi:hypothetical protein DKM44_06500 [Deinococcus irradiatisoli]|uniref:Uncharacterized protein n=1 Tax=Deinococcus irradiatisoli TaxID=2202254 RepID=A0A2Z3JJ14_9DEIO|nr:hypothetical protein [Deinococcus irradiatisoli]AWN22919.1 hypothetical protein DKM44_06500 [Deinococcus irradiatisoli]
MSDFDALQRAVEASAAQRQAEVQACEAFLTALYHVLRRASGPGLPLNNVTMEFAADTSQSLRPALLGGWHAAWFRLGLCEVRVQVRREGNELVGEYGPQGQFRLQVVDEAHLLALGREVLRGLAALYGTDERAGRWKN